MDINLENRESWLRKTLLSISEGSRILDAGAGELKYKEFCKHLRYTSQDFAKYDGMGNSEGLQTGDWDQSKLDIVSDISAIPVPNNSFDAVMCVEVFEHLPEPVLAIKEFMRILKPGGKLILTAPFCSLTHFSPYHYYSGFNIYFFEYHLEKEGFELIEISKNGNYFTYMMQELSRLKLVAEKYSSEKRSSCLIRLLEKIAIKIVFWRLKILNKLNKNSEELLCFGINLVAKKK